MITDVWWDSVNILSKNPVDESRSGWFVPRDQKYKYGELVEYLSKELVLPLQQLKVEPDFALHKWDLHSSGPLDSRCRSPSGCVLRQS